MNTGGEAAEQIVRMSLEGFEVAAKITGAGAKNIAILLYSILKEERKTKGKARLTSMLRSGKELKDFTRVLLKAGESQVVNFKITPDKLAFYDKKMKKIVEPGEFIVMVGASSDDKDLLKDSFFVK